MGCRICFEEYNPLEKRPRVVPCGHTFCTACLEHLLADDDAFRCPTCRAEHSASEASQFPVVYEVEELLEEPGNIPALGAYSGPLLEEEKDKLRDLSFHCHRILTEMEIHNADTPHLRQMHTDAIEVLERLTRMHREAQNRLPERTEEEQLDHQGRNLTNRVAEALDALERAQAPRDVSRAMRNAATRTLEVRIWTHVWRESCRDEDPLGEFFKILAAMKNALGTMTQDFKDVADSRAVHRVPVDGPQVIETWPLDTPSRTLAASGRLVVLQQNGNHSRYAWLTARGDTICLHHLQDSPPPTVYKIIRHEDLMARVDASSALTFLDLRWPPSQKGRVYIRMEPDWRTDLGRQFVLRCSAQMGPTYAHTRFSRLWKKRWAGKWVEGGHYDGVGGEAILDEMRDGVQGAWEEGVVGGLSGNGARRQAMFRICTRKSQWALATFPNPFGRVERGLDFVKRAAEVSDIRSVVVVDCGVVL